MKVEYSKCKICGQDVSQNALLLIENNQYCFSCIYHKKELLNKLRGYWKGIIESMYIRKPRKQNKAYSK